MVDIHTHLLPAFDDGPQTVEETRRMLDAAENGGTHSIVITPHILDITDYDREDEILQKFKLIKQIIRKEGRKLNVYLGGEIFLFPDTNLDRVFSTFNNNRKYALVEFGMRDIPEFVPQKLFDFLMEGFQPILAHPERYLPILKNPRYAYKFAQMGVALQMNAGSLLGVFGEAVKNVSHQLIEHNCIHIIASDGHNDNTRNISLAAVREYVGNRFGEEKARLFLETNPERALRGESLEREEPIPFENNSHKVTRWQILKRKFQLDKIFG